MGGSDATVDDRGETAEVPKWLGKRYRIIGPLGSGGMGAVYRARDEALQSEVALKQVLAPGDALAKLRDEVRLAQRVTHPNVCRTYDLEEIEGNWLVKMEYVAGETLAARLRRGALGADETVRIAKEICAGLGAAHRNGVVHRDLKPHNIMLEKGTGRVVLMDFGIARIAERVGQTAENVSGTPDYMSPEQARGREVDGRSDLYSLGCVLHEMLTGARPFARPTPMAAAMAHMQDPPPGLPASVPERVRRVVARLLEKEPAKRPTSAEEVAAALVPAPRQRRWLVAAVAPALLLAVFAGWLWRNAARARWARETAPEIERLLAADDYAGAVALVDQALTILPADAALEALRTRATWSFTFATEPPGAEVRLRPFGSSTTWRSLGRTPLATRVPKEVHVWELARPGYAPQHVISPDWPIHPNGPRIFDLTFALVPEADVPEGMVTVPETDDASDLMFPLLEFPKIAMDGFLLDRTEVTNAEYQRFVDAGGYGRRELWKEPFVRDGRTLSWADALSLFKDSTGQPGPATWELGHFPRGLDTHPVAGVSWYEASAYAAFAGKSLPTVFHWAQAAQHLASGSIVPRANFGEAGTVPVGSAQSGFGTYDMAGNVREWCLNADQSGRRYSLGGGFGDPTYFFPNGELESPWSRAPNQGFRCARLPAAPDPRLAGVVERASRDFRKEIPVSDEIFQAYRSLYGYDRMPVNAAIEATEQNQAWTREKITFDAAYGKERVIAYLYLPRNARPPFQTVVYVPTLAAHSLDRYVDSTYIDFIPRTGRALLVPIYKSTYERRDGYDEDRAPAASADKRDHTIMWYRDLGRSLDYLETRTDIDRARIAYLGTSWGACEAPIMLGVDNRFKAAVLVAGGYVYWRPRSLPEVDPFNFAPRVHVPVLMLNGRYDNVFPVETCQRPFFDHLGTPPEHKKHILFEDGHFPPRKDVIRETLAWLDTYLGPVGR